MNILTSKLFLLLVIFIFGVLVVLYFTGRKSVRSEILINASPEKVWDILMDTQKYPQWNPVFELVEGKIEEKSKVVYKFTQDDENSYNVSTKVIQIQPLQLLNQGGGVPLVLTFNHQYKIEPIGEKTKVIIFEKYGGIGVNFWNPEKVEAAYQRLNEALKKRAEK